MVTKLRILFFIFSISCAIHSQFLNEFGIKLGPSLTGHFTYYNDGHDQYEGLDLFRFDIGLFGSIVNYKRLTVLAEVHYTIKGENEGTGANISPIYYGQVIQKGLPNRFQYLSLEPLVKFNFYNRKNYYFYLIGGPRWDFRIGNYRNGYDNPDDYIHIKNFTFEFGMTIGTGVEFSSGLLFEFRFDPNFTNTYFYKDSYTSYKKRHSTVMFLAGLNLGQIIRQENKK